MSKKSKATQNNKSFKTIIILLACTMLAGLFYTYKITSRSKKEIITLREDKENMLKDLEKSQLFLNQIMTSNKMLSSKLVAEQDKIKQLILDLNSKNITEKNIADYKKTANNVDARIKSLLNEIDRYKKKIDSTNIVLAKTNIDLTKTSASLIKEKNKNDTLTVSNVKLANKISDASKLYFFDLKTNFFKLKSSGKLIETDNANKINLIKFSFMIAENNLAKPTTKDFYIQIIDSKNNVLGSKNVEKFGNETLNYSTLLKVKYQNKNTKVEGEIPVTNLQGGILFINVFDKSKLILNSAVTLS
ncbi:hypothetical protein QMU91_001500 [Flavobacterium psychrophilum]|nr:hypothetical protein [Flavobacterium psychrophilum]